MYTTQHLFSLEYEPDDFSDRSSRDGEEECSGSRSILLIDDDDEDVSASPAVVANKNNTAAAAATTTHCSEVASDVSGWTATSSSRPGSLVSGPGTGVADKQSRNRRPRPWDDIPINGDNKASSSSMVHQNVNDKTIASATAATNTTASSTVAAGLSQSQTHGLPPTTSSSAPTTLPKKDNKGTLNTQPSGERTPLLKQYSSRDSISSYTTQQVRNVFIPAYNSTSRSADSDNTLLMDTYNNKRLNDAHSPTAFSSAPSTAAHTVSTFASFLSRLKRRRTSHLHSPPKQFSWSGGFFVGDRDSTSRNLSPNPTSESLDRSESLDEDEGSLWSRLLSPRHYNDKSNEHSHTKQYYLSQHKNTHHPTYNHKNKGIHHATFRAAASNFYQEDSYEDVEGHPTSFIQTTFLAKKKKKTEWFVSFLSLLMILHFIIMMGYEILLWYIAFRRGRTTSTSSSAIDYNPNSMMGESTTPPPPFWFSSAGRIYNPTIGPNPTSLTLFGIFNPALCLLKSQYWRFLTALSLCSNFVQLIINMIVLITVVSPLEERYGSSTMCFTYVLCAWTGGIMSLLFSCNRNPNIPKVLLRSTTLTCSGLTGIAIMGVIERVFSQTREKVFNRLHSATGRKKSGFFIIFTVDRWGFPHFGVILGLTSAVFTSFASFESLLGGVIMGMCCGVLLFADMLKCLDDDDDDEDDTWSTEDDVSFAGLSEVDMDGSFAEAHTGAWNDDERIGSKTNYDSSNKAGSQGGKQFINALDGDDLRLRVSFKNAESAIVHGDASSPIKSPKMAKAHPKSTNALGTAVFLQMSALVTGLCCLLMPLLFIGMVLYPPSYQSMKDSIHGCVSMHSFYDFSMTDDQQQLDPSNPVCGEICTPFGLYRRIPLIASQLFLDIGTCSDQGFSCHVMSDFLAIGDKYDLSREVYAQASSDLSCPN